MMAAICANATNLSHRLHGKRLHEIVQGKGNTAGMLGYLLFIKINQLG